MTENDQLTAGKRAQTQITGSAAKVQFQNVNDVVCTGNSQSKFLASYQLYTRSHVRKISNPKKISVATLLVVSTERAA